MRVINSLVAAVISTQPVLGAFLPVSTFNEAASLTTREENVRKCLQPVSSVDLYYMEGKSLLSADGDVKLTLFPRRVPDRCPLRRSGHS
jgi:hypothetical protein